MNQCIDVCPTYWWLHCSSSWVGSHSWAPRTRGGWYVHMAPRRCGWLHGTWHRIHAAPGTDSAVCGWDGYSQSCRQAPAGKQGKSEGFDSCDRPSNLKLDSNRQFFCPCDREIWWMTLQNNRAPLLCYFKLCASFCTHWWIQT